MTGATLDTAAFDHDDDPATPDQVVQTSFAVNAGSTLEILASQADDHSADGAGVTDVANIAPYAGHQQHEPGRILTTGGVNIAVGANVILNSSDDFGPAGPTRVITVAQGVELTAPGSVVDGQYINGENALLWVDDENDEGNDAVAPPDTPSPRI